MAAGHFTTATLVPLFLEIGHLFEERSSRGARAAIEGIRRLSAQAATRIGASGEEQVSPDELAVGDTVLVRPGDVIPVDGEIVSGYSLTWSYLAWFSDESSGRTFGITMTILRMLPTLHGSYRYM